MMSKELIHVYRGDYIESIHYGSIAVVNAEGKLLKSAGNPDFKTFFRSSAKPIQALPVVFSGAAGKYNLTPRELAVMCASHSGEKIHIETVRSILQKINVSEDKLSCGVHLPYHRPSAEELIRVAEKPTAIHCNCSGKHSAMLTLCSYYGWDLDNYIDRDHPLQQLMIEIVSDYTDIAREDVWLGIDGCGVPVFGLPLKNMALAFARLSQPESFKDKYFKAANVITDAMYTNPELVGGTDRFCTDLMQATKGKLIGKAGAEAVYCVGIRGQGIGIAVKIEDGNKRGIAAVVMKVLKELGFITEEELEQLDKYRNPIVKNHHMMEIGRLAPEFELE